MLRCGHNSVSAPEGYVLGYLHVFGDHDFGKFTRAFRIDRQACSYMVHG